MKSTKPLVSVSLICYNQKNYIKQALDSVLMQKTNFKYEIVLSDDCSTDGTNLICEEYASKYPDKIRLIKHDHNLGGVKNYLENYKLCEGKYVSYLEGDDFYLDPYKLQKQVDFLEKNEDYVICCSHVEKIDENGKFLGQLLGNMNDTYTVEKLCEGDFIATPTCMVRNNLIDEVPQWLYEFNGCDWTFDIVNAQYGKIKFMNERLGAYRIHSSGSWSKLSAKQQCKEFINLATKVDEYLNYKYHDSFIKGINLCKQSLEDLKTAKPFLNFIRKNPFFLVQPLFYKKCLKYAFKRIYNCAKYELPEYSGFVNMQKKMEFLEMMYEINDEVNCNVLILDDMYPYVLSGFRCAEYNSYLDYFDNSMVLTSGLAISIFENEKRQLPEIIKEHFEKYPNHKRKIKILDLNQKINAGVAIICFLNNTYNYLNILEKNKIPFVFTLYPGGGFSLNDSVSDNKLQRVFSSPYFRKVIVTQKITYNYLIDNNFCKKEQIELINGGVILDNKNDLSLGNKQHFYYDKNKLDVCFVAQKYSLNGHDKGYDIFIEVAKKLAKKYNNINFHVVGGFSENDIDVSDIKDRIRFYGVQEFSWFKEFYRDKDIIVSPNVPFVLGPGAFDGFPVTCALDAMKNEVAAICSDELNCNTYYTNEKDMVIIKPNVDEIVEKVEFYYNNPEKLKKLGINGKKTTENAYSYDNQIMRRINVLNDIIKRSK